MDFGPDEATGLTQADRTTGKLRLEPITEILRIVRKIRAGKRPWRTIDQFGGTGS